MKRMILLLDSQAFLNHHVPDEQLAECMNQLTDAIKKLPTDSSLPVWVCYSDCFFNLRRLQGFYITEPIENKETIEIQKRMTKAVEKIAEEHGGGEDWKKPME